MFQHGSGGSFLHLQAVLLRMPAAFLPHRYGFIMVAACLSVYVTGWALYNFVFLPRFDHVWAGHVARVVFNAVWVLSVWSFLRAHCTDAGRITEHWRQFVEENGIAIFESKQGWQPAQATMCSKCQEVRPERAHHCSATGVCVQRMDHYCPWTANCIGFQNHKFFLQVAFYTFLANFIGFVTMAPTVLCIVFGFLQRCQVDFANVWQDVLLVVAQVAVIPIVLLFGKMNWDHLPRACRNLTAVEALYNNMPNPYDLGSSRMNLSQVMGKCGLDWVLPIRPWYPLSDGVSFSRSFEAEDLERESSDKFEDPEALLKLRYSALRAHHMADVDDVSIDEDDSDTSD